MPKLLAAAIPAVLPALSAYPQALLASLLLWGGLTFAQNPNTAKFPGALDGDAEFLVANDAVSTLLDGAVTATATSITVDSAATLSAFPVSCWIGGEVMKIASRAGNVLTVASDCASGTCATCAPTTTCRGWGHVSTTEASHLDNAAFTCGPTAEFHNAMAASIIAIETALGASLVNVVEVGDVAGGGLGGTYPNPTVDAPDPTTFNLTGTYAALPAAATAGRTYQPTDAGNLYSLIRDNGSTWDHHRDSQKLTLPVGGDFTWVNQGTATITTTAGAQHLFAPKLAGNNLRMRVDGAPAAPYTVKSLHFSFASEEDFHAAGILFRESGTGKVVVLNQGNGSVSVVRYTNPTTFSAVSIGWKVDANTGSTLSFKIEDDNTDLKYFYSGDGGLNYIELFSEGRTVFMAGGPDEIGFFANSSDATFDVGMTLIHWLVE